jgi:hypothetical protein
VLVEGKIVETGLEIIAKKLIDIFGDRIKTKLFNKNKTRTASRDAYQALREIEQAFGEIESILDDPLWSEGSREEWLAAANPLSLVPPNLDPKTEILHRLFPQVSTLLFNLNCLKRAFAKIKVDMEIYDSVDKAATVDLYIFADTNILKALFNYKLDDEKFDVRSLIPPMRQASALARKTISSFIAKNFPIEAKP